MPKFKKGQSGNPGGRPKGSKNKATLFKERIFDLLKNRDKELKKMDIRDLAFIASKFVPKEIIADVEHSGVITVMPTVTDGKKKIKYKIGATKK